MNRLSFFLIAANVITVALILFLSLGKLQQEEVLRFISLALLGKSDKGSN